MPPDEGFGVSNNKSMKRNLALIGSLCMAALARAAGPHYTLVELRHPLASPNASSNAWGINDRGMVAGSSTIDNHWFIPSIWQGTTFATLPLPSWSPAGVATAVNKKGQVAGYVARDVSHDEAAFWDNGQFFDVGTLQGFPNDSYCEALNNLGQCVGTSNLDSQTGHAFSWAGGTLTDLGSLDSESVSLAHGVNDPGVVVGETVSTVNPGHAVFWNSTGIHDLGIPNGYAGTAAFAVNSSSQIAGMASPNSSGDQGAFWTNGQLQTVTNPLPNASGCFFLALNDLSQCVGYESFPTDGFYLALWSPSVGFVDLSSRTSYSSNWSSASLTGINNKGQIVGNADYQYSSNPVKKRREGFRLDPDTTVVFPTAYTIVYGRSVSGSVGSLSKLDSDPIRVSRAFVPTLATDPIQIRIEGNLPWNPLNFWFRVTAKSNNVGSFSASINLYNWTSGVYDPASNVTVPLGQSYIPFETVAIGDISRFVRPSDRRVWALFRARQTGFVAVIQWSIDVDQAVWEAVPAP